MSGDTMHVYAEPYEWDKPHPIVVPGERCPACCCGGPGECSECGLQTVHEEEDDEVAVGDGDYEWVHSYRCQNCGWSYESGYR